MSCITFHLCSNLCCSGPSNNVVTLILNPPKIHYNTIFSYLHSQLTPTTSYKLKATELGEKRETQGKKE